MSVSSFSQDFRSYVGRFQSLFRQTGPLPPRADEKDERSHQRHQQVRRRTGQNPPQGTYLDQGS